MTTIEIIGALISLLYLRLEYKASIWLWPVGILTPLLYIYIFFVSKFYADMGINGYYLLASVYGWYCWKKSKVGEMGLQISHLPQQYTWRLFTIFTGLFGLIAWILVCYTDSPVPYGDALTTALSIVAMWMLARKYVEQWILWFVINGLSAGLYFWKGLYPTGILFIIYTIVPIFGYIKWKKMIGPTPHLSIIRND